MFNKSKNHDPLLVKVHDGRYECFGVPTARSTYLFTMFQAQGISDTVPDGYYHFNVKREGFKLVATLLPAPPK